MTTKQVVFQCLKEIGIGKEFFGFYIERANAKHQLSGLRKMRELRQEGKINYIVTNRRKSRYKLTALED